MLGSDDIKLSGKVAKSRRAALAVTGYVALVGAVLAFGAVWQEQHLLGYSEAIREIGGALLSGAVIGAVIFVFEDRLEGQRATRDEELEQARDEHDANLAYSQIRHSIITALTIRDDLRGIILDYQDLEGIVLAGRNLKGARLRGTRFSGANLAGAELSNAMMRGAWLDNADLRGANLSGADLSHCVLVGAKLEGADLTGANLDTANLTGSRLGFVPFQETELVNWSQELSGDGPVSLRDASLSRIRVFGGSALHSAILRDLDLSESWLCGADLSSANLSGSVLRKANLRDCSLMNANLERADLSGANLSGAILDGANMRCANLSHATLGQGLSENRYTSLIGTDITELIWTDSTEWPPGHCPSEAGGGDHRTDGPSAMHE